jgi:hypothetical protein
MRDWRGGLGLALATALVCGLPAAGERFVVVEGNPLPETPGRAVIVLGETTVAIAAGCPDVPARVRARRRATRVSAAWSPATPCTGIAGKALLRARVADDCTRLQGTLTARKGRPRRRQFTAARSACGDGVTDIGGGEACDQDDSAACPGACRPDCSCAPTVTTTTLPGSGLRGVYGVTDASQLVHFGSDTPGTIVASVALTGLGAGEQMAGIDFRPATGELYGLGVATGATHTARLYRVDASTGVATAVGAPIAGLVPGSEYGLGFNPVADRLRVVNDGDANLRVNPNDGAALPDTSLNPAGRLVRALAYVRAPGGTSATLYGLCFASSELVRIGGADGAPPSPNGGAIFGLGGFGVGTVAGSSGFAVDPVGGTAFATLREAVNGLTGLYTVDLGTGATTLIGPVGDGTQKVPGIAVAPGGGALAAAVRAGP